MDIFRIVSGDSPESIWKLCLSTNFLHQEIRWNYYILRCVTTLGFLGLFRIDLQLYCGTLKLKLWIRVRLNSLYSQLPNFKLDALPSRIQYQSSHWFVIYKKIFFDRKVIINYMTNLSSWKVSKYGVFSGPYIPAIGEIRSISPYSLQLRENTN